MQILKMILLIFFKKSYLLIDLVLVCMFCKPACHDTYVVI